MDKLLTEANKTAAALNAETIATQQAEIRRLEGELDILRRNGLNAIRLRLDEAKDPYKALALAKEDIRDLKAEIDHLRSLVVDK